MDKKPKKKTQALAHSRRQRENDTFTDIAQALPIQENAKDLDKASILRLAIHYLKLRDLIRDGNDEVEGEEGEEGLEGRGELEELVASLSPKSKSSEEPSDALVQSDPTIADFLPNFSKDVVQALDGFLMVISRDGRVLFSSESIANYLGLRQVDVIGVNVQDIIHPQDCSEVVRIFQSQGQDTEQVFDQKEPLRRKFVVRMRCAFTPSVRCITRCSNFKPIYCSCFLKFGKSGGHKGQFLGMVAFCKLATLSKIKEMVVGTFFKTKHSLDLSYTSVDTRIRWILGYDPSEMTGLKAYQYFHPQDLGVTSSCHMNLLSRGLSHSPCYRFMTRWGDWVWCRSKSQMIFNKNSHLPEGIVIYTWIVRVDEEDDRMLAIKKGGDGESERKTYDSFSSSISSSSGSSLDVSALANPFSKTQDSPHEATPTTPPSSTPTTSRSSEPTLPYSPPLSAESSPVKLPKMRSPPSQPPSCQMAGNMATPPMGGNISSPPMGTLNPVGMGVGSPPMGGGNVSSPPMQGGINPMTPPMSMGVSSPPMGGVPVSSPPQVDVTGVPYSSNCSSTHMEPFNVTSDVADQSFLFDQGPLNQSFMMSPPYTPYVNQNPATGGMPGDSPAYTNVSPSHYSSNRTPSPNAYQNSCLEQSYSPPYSSTSATPSFDPMLQSSAPSELPLLPESVEQFMSQTAPTMHQQLGDPLPRKQMGFNGSHMTNGGGHMTHLNSLSSTPSPSMEVQATFIPNGNSTSNLSSYTESFSVPLSTDMNMFGMADTSDFIRKSTIPSLAQAPPQVRQNVISSARQRYSGAAPSGHASSGSGALTGHVVTGHHARGGGSGRTGGNADDSISQWTQWLQGSAPAPVC